MSPGSLNGQTGKEMGEIGKRCYYCVTSVFKLTPDGPRFSHYVNFCYRPWPSLGFRPTIPEMRDGFSRKF